MNRIEQLLAELCPDGVEFRELGEVLGKFKNIKWAEQKDNEFKYIDLSSVDRVQHKIIEWTNISKDTAPSRAQQILKSGDVIFGTTRPMLKRYCLVSDVFDGQIASTGYCILRANTEFILPNYIFHSIGTEAFYDFVSANERGASYPAIPDNVVKQYKIPIPPLEIQKEIVKILDKFVELQAELQAELQKRKIQYEYYRNALLTFPDSGQRTADSGQRTADSGQRTADDYAIFPWLCKLLDKCCPEGVEFKELDEIGIIFGGLNGKSKSDFTNGNAKYISYINVLNNIAVNLDTTDFVRVSKNEKQRQLEYGDILFTGSSETANEVAMSSVITKRTNEPIYLNSFCIGYRLNNSGLLLPDFSKHLFRSDLIRQHLVKTASGVTRFNVSKKRLAKLKIPVPPLPVQQKIVAVLDKFDALVNDLTMGLPAEIKARRTQYEYYRNQLLMFKERSLPNTH